MNPDLCAVVKDEAQARHAAAPQGAQAAMHTDALAALSIETIQSVVKGLIGAGQKALTGTANDVIDKWRGGVLQWSTPEEWEALAALANRMARGTPAGGIQQ